MRSGTGDDPFDDEGEQSDDQQPERESSTQVVEAAGPSARPPSEQGDRRDDVVDAIPKTDADVPWIMLRGGVKQSRGGGVAQIEQTEATDQYFGAAGRELEARFDDDLGVMDVREAIFIVGMMHLDDVEHVLREWGYDYEEG